jgi:hypothetical protein
VAKYMSYGGGPWLQHTSKGKRGPVVSSGLTLAWPFLRYLWLPTPRARLYQLSSKLAQTRLKDGKD